MTVDAVVAGAGVWGCTVARRLAESGRRVLVLERRKAVGGNVRCETDAETGIEVHTYGSHIFHTHIPEVWEFVNRFVKFNGYQHKVLARYRGKTYFLPLGLALIEKFFGVELKPCEADAFLRDEARSKAVFDAFFRGYTSKQWGRPPEEIDPSIIKRVPVRTSYDVNYFNDYNQGIPLSGYNSLFERLLDHPGIEVRCNAAVRLEGGAFWVGGDALPCVPVYYSGPVDELFGYRFGHLPWRTLRFETERLDVRDYQGTSVVNYTEAEHGAIAKVFPGYAPTAEYLTNEGQDIHLRLFSSFSKAVLNASAYNKIAEKKNGIAATSFPLLYEDIKEYCGEADLSHNQKLLAK